MAKISMCPPSSVEMSVLSSKRDGHVHVLPTHVANKIAAGEVVERPASVVKELIENAIDAKAKSIRLAITQGGRKLISVKDDGSGMTKDDALMALERQATSKILNAEDIDGIDTLGFRGEAIPSIASVSRFSLTTRLHNADEGVRIQVEGGKLVQVSTAGCPPGTLVEVRDLFCNVPARQKFLRSIATEESHIRRIFTVHALAHPEIAFTLVIDGREIYRLAIAYSLIDRVRDIFGNDFVESSLTIASDEKATVKVHGLIEKPNLTLPTRAEQYIFVNHRPATAPTINYALREAYPRRQGDIKMAAIIFIELNPRAVDVNVHPTKREVRFKDNTSIKSAIIESITRTLKPSPISISNPSTVSISSPILSPTLTTSDWQSTNPYPTTPTPAPIAMEFAFAPDSQETRPWKYFKYLAQSESGYLLIETDSGIVTINPIAARERIAYEKLLSAKIGSQTLLIPETIELSPVDFSRVTASLSTLHSMGFSISEFGLNTIKIDAVPQLLDSTSTKRIIATIASDLAEGATRKSGDKWREEIIAKSIARSFAGANFTLTKDGATKLIEELCATKMPYICPRGKPVMIFTSTRELDRKFDRL